MIGRRAIVGLSLLCAVSFCAFTANNALAATAANTTAFTCVLGEGSEDFKDAHCDQKVSAGTGFFGHEAISNGTTTELDVTNAKTQNLTTSSTPAVLKGEIFFSKLEIVCTVVVDVGAVVKNEEDILKGHTMTGQTRLRLSSCTVTKPTKCTIKEPLDSEILEFRGREELGLEKKEMGVEFNGGGPAILFTITLENKGAEKCALAGKPFKVEGTAIATGGTETQTEKHGGATTVFTNAMTKETVKIGGKAAEFSASLTASMSGNGSPIAFTTTT